MINNHILAMSGAVYWLGAIFFVKDNGVFCNLWMVPPCRSLESSSPPEPDQSKSLYTESVQNQCLLEKYNSWIFFLILSYDVYIRARGIFFFRFFEYSFCWNRSITLNTVICRNRGFFVLNAYIQKIMQLIS